jgi:hypothetical protein
VTTYTHCFESSVTMDCIMTDTAPCPEKQMYSRAVRP